ncbi:max dimerization protein 3 isoform X2 [Ammospiza caudacuta]|uniref:max dimerization protein 3 isoform X2 n=1 Tax=Ammospiza caudacuta TaxID=2857398 RepID=UPI0027394261|nr:max dimerization protein 3 isoform X2 [Ammospiza caudacuta]
MEPAGSRIQVLLQAAEFLEHREHRHPLGLAGAEHGYAALCPAPPRRAPGLSRRSVHNALEKHRRAQLRCCLERLKQQVPLGVGPARSTTLSLLHRARLHIQRLEEQELRARRAKDRLRDRQRSLQRRLESLLLPADGERARADSLDSSRLSELSEEEDAEVEVDGVVFSGDLLPGFGTGREHSYSSPHSPAS